MKQNKRIFNSLLSRYNKYLRKRKNLILANKNERRQAILAKHIERLFEKLMSLKLSITKGTVAATVVLGALAFVPQEVAAQNFGAPQTNPFGLTALGYGYSAPVFVDLDGDGDMDIMSGEGYYGNLTYFQNTGTNLAPVFAAPQTNPFGLTLPLFGYSTPVLVDLDGDGDFDLMMGDYPGNFQYFQNTGTNTAPAFGAAQTNPFGLTALSYNSAPTFADLDGDGDFDLVSGDRYGNFAYFQNTGTNTAPAFGTAQTNPFGLTALSSNSTPTFVDLDGDGDFDLLSGQYYYGDFYYFQNTGTNTTPAFSALQTNPFGLTGLSYNSAPTFTDLDGDGNIDMLSGEQAGDFYYFRACMPSSATISPTAVCSYTSPSGNNVWTATGNYMDTIPNISGCDSVITINLTVDTLVDQILTASPPVVCGTDSTTISLGSSQSGVNYYLRDNTNDTIIDGPIVGAGSGISLNTGTISSAMTYNVYSESIKNTKALNFNGMSNRVDCGNSASVQLSGNQITLEAWVYPTVWKGAVWGGSIINKERDGAGVDFGYMIRCGNNGQISFNLGNGNWNDLVSPTNSLALNTWQHIAATYNGTVMSIYVNGMLVASQNTTITFSSPTSNLSIGNWSLGTGRTFIGKIDEVRIWSVAKTQIQIQTDMNTCLAGTETGLAVYYQFEDGTGSSTLTDLTANGNNGTLANMNPTTDWREGTVVCSSCNLVMTQTITVTVGQATASSISPTACISYASPSGNYTWTTSGNYMDTIPNASGCDSVITINLTINTVDTTTSINGNVITSNQMGATYQWIDCNNGNSAIAGETNADFTAITNGDYAVEVTINGCTDTSVCVNITGVGIKDNNLSNNVSIYPNPTKGLFTISFSDVSTKTTLVIYSAIGEEISNQIIKNNKTVIDLTTYDKGIYFIKVQNKNKVTTKRIIKQ